MTIHEKRNVLPRAWRCDRIMGKAHGDRGYEFIWERSDERNLEGAEQ